MPNWPDWYEWELEFDAHLEERMKDRGFDEVDLRLMIETAAGYRPDHVDGRWIIDAIHDGRAWEVIVEPLADEQRLMVVTAYAPDQGGRILMNQRYLQVTYRNGLPLAAYLYLPRAVGDKATRSVKCEGGLVVDYAADGRPIGIEISAPRSTTLESLNRALAAANQAPIAAQEIQPLLAAAA